MTICIATLCDNRKSLVLVADKMLGTGFVQAELNIQKRLRLRRDWWAMLAGNDISPAFDVVDHARQALSALEQVTVDDVAREITDSYQKKRLADAEALYLRPRGWTTQKFAAEGRNAFPEALFREIDSKIQHHELSLTLLVAGFDGEGHGHILCVDNPGVARRHDAPGFAAIGSGSFAALSMMFYRELNVRMPVYDALYYAFEAKISGEQALGVGVETDMFIAGQGGPAIRISKATEKRLETIWQQLRPGSLKPHHRQTLKKLPAVKKLLRS
jgi:hypothetical protein